jgi:hypothetical protein
VPAVAPRFRTFKEKMSWRGHTITPPTDNRNLPIYKVRKLKGDKNKSTKRKKRREKKKKNNKARRKKKKKEEKVEKKRKRH